MPLDLTSVEARVLGCLIEKDLATPEYYPLSLNALTNACNQKSNREPVVSYEDSLVYAALASLRDLGLASFVTESGSRVEKYKHRLSDRFNFSRGELAALAVLLLRGPQTTGELRTRCERMHPFADLDAVEHTLHKLESREPDSLARLLERQPGQKEQRWAHLMSGEPPVEVLSDGSGPAAGHSGAGAGLAARVERLETEVAELREKLESLLRQLT